MKTILVVDDEYGFAQALIELLEDQGYRVVAAANGRDGLTRLKDENPDLVLTDNMMPIASGKELIRGMRALPEHRSTPVIMMSSAPRAVALANNPDGAIDVSAFLSKPFLFDELLKVIERLIGEGELGATVN